MLNWNETVLVIFIHCIHVRLLNSRINDVLSVINCTVYLKKGNRKLLLLRMEEFNAFQLSYYSRKREVGKPTPTLNYFSTQKALRRMEK